MNLTVSDEEVKVVQDKEKTDEGEEGEKEERFHRTPTTVIRMEVFIALAVVSLYITAPTLTVIEQSLDASEQNI